MKTLFKSPDVLEDVLILKSLRSKIENVLTKNILEYWYKHFRFNDEYGFPGIIDKNDNSIFNADKGLILHARILWAMSRAYGMYHDERMKKIATETYNYIIEHFMDTLYGGFYWELDCRGNIKNSRKSTYGQAFAVYALSEYGKVFRVENALSLAMKTFNYIEYYARDMNENGYIETFSREWKTMEDIRLSSCDMNAAKSNNTHLHIMEAYTNLYSAVKDEFVRDALKNSIEIMINKIWNFETKNFRLFFDEKWNSKSDKISCGHEIEAAWLITRAMNVLSDREFYKKNIHVVEEISAHCANYLEHNLPFTAMNNEIDVNGEIDRDKIWWVQAEACIGFFNYYQITLDENYLTAVSEIWSFIETHIVDEKNGEWYWYAKDLSTKKEHPNKIDNWKSCYHNIRVCVEMIERIDKYTGEKNEHI